VKHLLLTAALLGLVAGCGAPKGTILNAPVDPGRLPAELYLNIEVGDHGTMKVRFHTKDAPVNSANVANLAIKGFYDGLTFHRIIPGFVVQGGDPQGDGTGGPGYDVQAEIKRKHLKGSLAMARTGDQVNPQRRSSGSQFYLCLEPLAQLDGAYTVIGDVVEGMDVLERIGAVATGAGDRPLKPVVMNKVTVTTK
jgi:cyclophilin family peptidyl-prolyl cis-trans isomerase